MLQIKAFLVPFESCFTSFDDRNIRDTKLLPFMLALCFIYLFVCCIDRPITFLYNTLHYYEQCLRDKPALKKKLVGAITGELACK